ncbi:hypothetical protein AMS68_002970 [Peltaster fructicola]|uniref:Uncharacterized protein n=1 Tax=Peltaster fructicola TaxID=286661 RepID=A0A6H0XRW7_9PEZI|nr:hypothetical protein AMS68_002970 [Peltaster fructicola]
MTGVSVQTMHPSKFDHGLVLAQRKINIQEEATGKHVTTADLIDQLGPIGGDLLVESVKGGHFLHPQAIPLAGIDASRAPKITPSDRLIDWRTWTAQDILARDNALSHLWDKTTITAFEMGASGKRIVYKGPWSVLNMDAGRGSIPGTPVLLDDSIGWTTVDGAILAPSAATIEGEGKDQGLGKLRRLLRSAHDV